MKFLLNANVTKLIYGEKLEGAEVTYTSGEKETIEISGLFAAIGRVPENGGFAGVASLDTAGYIVAGEDCTTGTPGVFAAGDARSKSLRQLVTAVSDGALAATGAAEYLNG